MASHLPHALRVLTAVVTGALLAGCGTEAANEAAAGELATDAATSEEATAAGDARAEPRAAARPSAGFAPLEAHCPFPYELQHPPGLEPTERHRSVLVLTNGDDRRLTLRIDAEEGSVHKEGLSRTLDQTPGVRRAAVLGLGGERVPVYTQSEPATATSALQTSSSRTYQFWYPIDRIGEAVMWHRMTATALSRGDADPIDEALVLQVIGTLTHEGCS